jgi:hypothetical protein
LSQLGGLFSGAFGGSTGAGIGAIGIHFTIAHHTHNAAILHKYEFADGPIFPHDSIVNAPNQYIDLDVIPAIQSSK